MRAVLPDLNHLTRQHYNQVYEPSDDTYLLCDALLQESTSFLCSLPQPLRCLELGSGSGTVITYLAQLLTSLDIKSSFLAIDINPIACEVTKQTARCNNCHVDVVQADLVSTIRPRSIDILLFNPPYVPTPNEEISGTGIEVSWAGGEDGRVVIDRLLPMVSSVLSATGVFYMILVEENKPKEVVRELGDLGFASNIVLKRRASNELLMVLKAIRSTE